MNLIETNSNDILAKKVANYINEMYIKSISERGLFTLVLSGGNTPKFVFDELVANYSKKIDWTRVHLFWLDERCVPPEDKDSNYKLAKDHLLNFLYINSIHRIQGELDPENAAIVYEKVIKEFFELKEGEIPAFDLILLGMGEDGHCASLFPESSEVKEVKRLVVSTQKKHNGHKRITLTLPIINKSDKILMIGSQEKLDVLNDTKRALPIHLVSRENMEIVVKI